MNSFQKLRLAAAFAFAVTACQSGSVRTDSTQSEKPLDAPHKANAAMSYGAAFQPGPQVALATLLGAPGAYTGQTVTTQGTVQRACTRKGCWMELGDGAASCRVTFKDYGFFVPTDSAGAQARVQGHLDTRVVAKADVDHLESEGARFANKQADGTALEVRLIASAVELTR